jgi:hypothetical protein
MDPESRLAKIFFELQGRQLCGAIDRRNGLVSKDQRFQVIKRAGVGFAGDRAAINHSMRAQLIRRAVSATLRMLNLRSETNS